MENIKLELLQSQLDEVQVENQRLKAELLAYVVRVELDAKTAPLPSGDYYRDLGRLADWAEAQELKPPYSQWEFAQFEIEPPDHVVVVWCRPEVN